MSGTGTSKGMHRLTEDFELFIPLHDPNGFVGANAPMLRSTHEVLLTPSKASHQSAHITHQRRRRRGRLHLRARLTAPGDHALERVRVR